MLIKDSSGRKSWHLSLAVPALIAASIWFLAGGISLEFMGWKIITATKSGSDYLLFVSPWLSALGWRDYLKQNVSVTETITDTQTTTDTTHPV